MYSYVVDELPAIIEARFPASDRRGVFGHSMKGHGALVIALRNPGDPFLADQLHPEAPEAAARAGHHRLTLRRHAGYDHSYWFIQTFIADHLA